MKPLRTGMYTLKRCARLLLVGMLLALFVSAAYTFSPASHKAAHADGGCSQGDGVPYNVEQGDSSYASWDGASADIWPCISNDSSTIYADAYVSFNGSVSYNYPGPSTYSNCIIVVNLYKVGTSAPISGNSYNCSNDFWAKNRGIHYYGSKRSYSDLINQYGSGQYWCGAYIEVSWLTNEDSIIVYEIGTDILGTPGTQVG